MTRITTTVVALLCLAHSAHAAALGETDAPLVCAVVDMDSCIPGDGCQRETTDTMNTPQLLAINWNKQEISGQRPDGQQLATTIERVTRGDQFVVLNGTQNQLTWTVTIARGNGRMSLAAVGDGVAFTVFGSCAER